MVAVLIRGCILTEKQKLVAVLITVACRDELQ